VSLLDRGVAQQHGLHLGLIDDDGRVRFRGRLKEMIKTGGINVAPLEVEAVLLRSEEHTSELQSRFDLVCRLLLEKKKKKKAQTDSHTKREILYYKNNWG